MKKVWILFAISIILFISSITIITTYLVIRQNDAHNKPNEDIALIITEAPTTTQHTTTEEATTTQIPDPTESTSEAVVETFPAELDTPTTYIFEAMDRSPIFRGYPIDEALWEALSEPNLSNYETTVVWSTYEEEWKALSEYYIRMIKEHTKEYVYPYTGQVPVSESLDQYQENWAAYYEQSMSDLMKLLHSKYGTGTIAGPLAANYSYHQQRRHALELFYLCDLLSIPIHEEFLLIPVPVQGES